MAITGVDYAFEGVPDRVAAGNTLTFTNASEDEAHEVVAIRIPDDVDLSVAELIALDEAQLDALIPPGPPAAVLIAGPGEEGFAIVGDGTLAEDRNTRKRELVVVHDGNPSFDIVRTDEGSVR